MMNRNQLKLMALSSMLLAGAVITKSASAAMLITEVDAAGSSASYAADWFELTNTGSTAVDITGWKMDDNSNAFANSVALRGVTSIAAGQSVVFLEGLADGSTDSTIGAAFKSAWFGSNVPSTLTLGFYGGDKVGLSTSGDAVNLFNSTGTLIANVSFGTASSTATFDNSTGLNNTTISQYSVAGTNGAFVSASGAEIGSPGVVPLPAAGWLLCSGLGMIGSIVRRRAQ